MRLLRGAACGAHGQRGARLSAFARIERRDRQGVSPGLRAKRPRDAHRTLEDEKHHARRHGRGRRRAPGGRRSRPARFLLRPVDVSDFRCARTHHCLRRPRPIARRQAEIHQHRRHDALFQGSSALQFRARAPGGDQEPGDHRRRRLYGCDRAGARRLRGVRRSARNGLDRRSAPSHLANGARTDPPSTATRRACVPPIAPRIWRCRT